MVESTRHPTILVGFGRMGKLHAEHAIQLADLRYIVEPLLNEEDPFTKQLRETNKITFVKTIEEVDPTGIKAIIVCCYAKDRKQYFEYAVKHRLAFFSEKPLCHNVTEGLDIVKLYQQPENADLPVMLGFQWRFDNILKKLIEAESEAVTVHIFARDPWGPPAAYFNISGGTVVEFGVHAIDYFNAITRSDVQEISATGLKKYFGEEYVSEDISVVTFKTFKGNLGVITLGWHNKGGYEQRAEVFDLEKGIIKADDPEGLVTNDKGNPVPHFVRRYKQAFHDELKFFFDNLVGRTGAEIAAHKGKYSSTVEGYKTMVWALLAQASQAKRNVIKLESADDVFDLAKIKALAE